VCGRRPRRAGAGGDLTEFSLPAGSIATDITTGPDGALWFTENASNKIGRITTAGAIAEFPIPTAGSGLRGIITGPDGALWFTENVSNKIGRITTAGVITEIPVPTPSSTGITAGPDGTVWFTEFAANKIGHTTVGGIAEFPASFSGAAAGTGDFNGDGKSDILWRDTSSGTAAIWLMNGAQVTGAAGVGSAPFSLWSISETGDFNGDGKSDILWHDSNGNVAIWFMNGTRATGAAGVGNVPAVWSIQGAGAD
jgi:hypothetical protein